MSQLKLIRPFTVTPDNLTTTVDETGNEYSPAVTYAEGEVVQFTYGADATHRRYESVVAGNVGNALTDESKWLDLGATNRWAMFDQVNGTQTTNDNDIGVSIDVTGRADGIALFNVSAETIEVTVDDAVGNEVFNQTYSLVSSAGITSWYAYFSEEIAYSSDLVITDLPLFTDPTITVEITSDSGDVACGTLVLGQVKDLGGTLYGARGGITDYSRKTTDEFGNTSITERAFAKRVGFKTMIPNSMVDGVFDALVAVRAIPCVWVGTEDFRSTWIYGWARDWATEIAFVNDSYVTVEIEGLT